LATRRQVITSIFSSLVVRQANENLRGNGIELSAEGATI
jgi:hypothetical protein